MANPINKTTSTNLNWWNWSTKPPPPSIYHTWETFKQDPKTRYYSSMNADAERALLASTFKRLTPTWRITPSSVVHDTGPRAGAATSVILDMLDPKFKDEIPEILIRATTQHGVDTANECYANWAPRITAKPLDTQDMSSVPDAKFTHSIALFDMFQFPHAPQHLREIYCTLRADGVGVLLAWKRDGWYEVIRRAQSVVRPDLPVLISSVMDFSAEGVLLDFIVEAGFSEGHVEVSVERTVRTGEHIDEMKKFLLWDGIQGIMTEGWSDEEKGRWPTAVGEAIQKEVEEYGGVLFEGWTAIARK